MKNISFLSVGILFGIILYKSEAISWFRIQEMFRFQSFHMYGIIGVAVVLGIGIHLMIRKGTVKDFYGQVISVADKPNTLIASILGGTLFGLGWAMTGACPGPLYILFGAGYGIVIISIISGIIGALLYGILRSKLPH
ncbi:MAG: YeeE/YedE family protein [Saprospiraceae bacterium]|nr:YeeE/YedE family protein [Saprospiraceae bacterium]